MESDWVYCHFRQKKDSLNNFEVIELDKQNPNSKFILNTRNLDDWLDSREKHILRRKKKGLPIKHISPSGLLIDRPYWEQVFKVHHQEVLEYFKDRQEDLLIIDVPKGDGWEKLCAFLGYPIPDVPFPQKNTAIEQEKKIESGK